jgi:hypothetical protein
VKRQLGEREAGGLRRSRKPRLRVEIAVGVDVDDPGLPVFVDAQVYPAVVAALERLEGGSRHLDAARLERLRQHREA